MPNERVESESSSLQRLRSPSLGFFLRHLWCKKAAVMTNTIEHWPALGKWSVAYFRDCFAERLVRVRVQPDRVDPETWIRHCANYRDMRFGDFLDRIDAEVGNRHYMAHSALLAMIPALQRL